ncbi:MAG TPA: hypothetical protein PLK12_03060 [Prolixibacteraceae bacterium]|nr:hypothetical protein [Prolixibacteraceae bacterium]
MQHSVHNVFIAGGTGFLGYHSGLLFLRKGCRVGTLALPDEINLEGWYPKEIETYFGDVFRMQEEEIVDLLSGKGWDTFVYALGPDDRVTPPFPAYDFFHERLVVQCAKICRAANKAGIRRCIVLNSYFAYFDRKMNGTLSRHHPYIRCRVEQAEVTIGLGEAGVFDVMILELPYIFGAMPGRIPIWKSVFLDRFEKMPFAFFPGGGTAAIHVSGVAEAVYAAAVNGAHGGRYPVSTVNISYRTMIRTMFESASIPKRIITIPAWIGYVSGWWLMQKEKKNKKEPGLHLALLMTQILSRNFFIHPQEMSTLLDFASLGFSGGDDAMQGIREAMARCYPASSGS